MVYCKKITEKGMHMVNKELLEKVGKCIEKYYVPEQNDIKLDHKMKSKFNRITMFREKKEEAKQSGTMEELDVSDYEIDKSAGVDFNVTSMKKSKMTQGMSSSIAIDRKLDDLMNQVEETFSQRLLRMIEERGLSNAEVYAKAYVDRRHFSKIKKNINYTPNKKTVLAFSIALQLSVDEAKDLLGCAGYAFSRSSKMDIIVAYFLQNKIYDMFEINEVLDAYGQPVFE